MPTRRDVVRGVAVALTSSLLESRPSGAGEARRAQASPPGAAGALPTLVSLGDFETEARGRMTENARAYITGAAGDELTLRWNREGYDHIRLNPRVLNDVSRIDTSVTVFGVKLSHPILVAPTAYHRLVHAEGEIATARGAGAAAAMMGISSFATTSIEDIAKAGPQAEDEVRSNLAYMYLIHNRPKDARPLVDKLRLDRQPQAKAKAMYAAVSAETLARTGDAAEAKKLVETYRADDPEYGEIAIMLLRAQVFTFMATKNRGLARRAAMALAEKDPNMLAPFLGKGTTPEMQAMAREVLSEVGYATRQKMKVQRR